MDGLQSKKHHNHNNHSHSHSLIWSTKNVLWMFSDLERNLEHLQKSQVGDRTKDLSVRCMYPETITFLVPKYPTFIKSICPVSDIQHILSTWTKAQIYFPPPSSSRLSAVADHRQEVKSLSLC